jgi:hypothetical protein
LQVFRLEYAPISTPTVSMALLVFRIPHSGRLQIRFRQLWFGKMGHFRLILLILKSPKHGFWVTKSKKLKSIDPPKSGHSLSDTEFVCLFSPSFGIVWPCSHPSFAPHSVDPRSIFLKIRIPFSSGVCDQPQLSKSHWEASRVGYPKNQVWWADHFNYIWPPISTTSKGYAILWPYPQMLTWHTRTHICKKIGST